MWRALGFSHQSHLTSRFKRVRGKTPTQWLKSARGGADPVTNMLLGHGWKVIAVFGVVAAGSAVTIRILLRRWT